MTRDQIPNERQMNAAAGPKATSFIVALVRATLPQQATAVVHGSKNVTRLSLRMQNRSIQCHQIVQGMPTIPVA